MAPTDSWTITKDQNDKDFLYWDEKRIFHMFQMGLMFHDRKLFFPHAPEKYNDKNIFSFRDEGMFPHNLILNNKILLWLDIFSMGICTHGFPMKHNPMEQQRNGPLLAPHLFL